MTTSFLSPGPDLYPSADLFPGELHFSAALLGRALETISSLLGGGDESDIAVVNLLDAILWGGDRIGEAAWGSTLGLWRGLIDPAVCADWALPYAAQVTFADMPGRNIGESDDVYFARARDAVLHPPQRLAGTPGAIRAAVRPLLTGSQAVKVVFNAGGDQWAVDVRVLISEAFDHEPEIFAAIQSASLPLPAGMKATCVLVTPGDPWTVSEFEDAYSDLTVADFEANFATVTDFESQPGGL